MILLTRSDAWFRVHVRSSQGRRRARLQVVAAAIRAALVLGVAGIVAAFLFAFGVLGASA